MNAPTKYSLGDLLPNLLSRDGQCRVVRSIDWKNQSITLQVLKYGDWFNYVQCSFAQFEDAGLQLDALYAGQILHSLVEYAKSRLVGKTKISKACLKRIQDQRDAAIALAS